MTGDPSKSVHQPLHYRVRHRLTHAREFDAVYAAKMKKTRGPITLFALPNALAHPRLGLAVSTRVGSAVVRNRWKRLVREAFRLRQYELPASGEHTSYDLIISVRPGSAAQARKPIPLATMEKTLVELALDADREFRRRARRSGEAS